MKNKKIIHQQVIDQWELENFKEIIEVQRLGELIGYGNMMGIASALWQISLKDKHQLDTGAFIPTLSSEMKKKEGDKALEQQANRVKQIKKILKNYGKTSE